MYNLKYKSICNILFFYQKKDVFPKKNSVDLC